MLALLLTSLVLAAPRTDGFYVDERDVEGLNAPELSHDELQFVEYVVFAPKRVTVHFLLEEEVHPWRSAATNLEVQGSDDAWGNRTWRELADGTVESDVLRNGEVQRLRFIKGSMDQRRNALDSAWTKAQLARLAGRYGEGADAVTVDSKQGLSAMQCSPDCETITAVCLTSKSLLLLETEEGLVRLPGVEGLCGGYRAGVAPGNGKLLKRMTPRAAVKQVEPRPLATVLPTCSGRLAACNQTTHPLKVKLQVTVGRSGLVSAVDAGEPRLSQCIAEGLSRLAFPVRAEPVMLSAEWELPVK